MSSTLMELFKKKALGLTVYTPDAAQSRLWGSLDRFIAEKTGLVHVNRHWFRHDCKSLHRFYSKVLKSEMDKTSAEFLNEFRNIPTLEITPEHLFVAVQLTGPSLVTFWQGDNAIEKLTEVKGSTHPADAAENTVRGGFWCDNPITNLMHASDDTSDMERELKELNLWDGLSDPARRSLSLPPLDDRRSVAHCSILVACNAANRILMASGSQPSDVSLPTSRGASEAVDACSRALDDIQDGHGSQSARKLAGAYLAGDKNIVIEVIDSIQCLTDWERLVLLSGLLTRSKWLTQSS